MRRLNLGMALSLVVSCLVIGAFPVLADCVSCGPGGECYAVSPGFSGNCESKIRSFNGVAACRPSGICDPNDATSCDPNGFPQGIASHAQISTRFLSGLAEVNPLLAGAAWAGIAEANSSLKPEGAEVRGTMGREGKSYSYRARVRLLEKGSASITIQVLEDGAGLAQDYEGTLAGGGRSGRFLQVGPKGRTPIFSWDGR